MVRHATSAAGVAHHTTVGHLLFSTETADVSVNESSPLFPSVSLSAFVLSTLCGYALLEAYCLAVECSPSHTSASNTLSY